MSKREPYSDDGYLHPFLGLLLAGSVYAGRRLIASFQRNGQDRINPEISSILTRWLRPRLGQLHHHKPVPLRFPNFYYEKRSRSNNPKISLVTPSLNQGRFLAAACESVLFPKLSGTGVHRTRRQIK